MTLNGGTDDLGTVMVYDISQQQAKVLYSFTGEDNDGASPHSCQVVYNNKLYGMTAHGGEGDNGTIFSMNKDGSDALILHSFKHNKGSQPHAFVIPDNRSGYGSMLYGVTRYGGPGDLGLIFSFNLSATDFEVMAYFSKSNGSTPHHGGLLQIGTTLYGLTTSHGKYSYGTAYSYDLSASSGVLNKFHDFGGSGDPCQKPKGSFVDGGDGYIYAATEDGGIGDNGCIFRFAYGGSGYQILYEFKGPTADGSNPLDNVIATGGVVYGMTKEGGSNPSPSSGGKPSYESGVVFSFTPS